MERRKALTPLDPTPNTSQKPPNVRKIIGTRYTFDPTISETFHDPMVEINERLYKKMNKTNMERLKNMSKEEKIKERTEKHIKNIKNNISHLPLENPYSKVHFINESSSVEPKESQDDIIERRGFGICNKYKIVKIHKLSPAQQRKLKNGNKVIIKEGGDHEIMLSPEQEKKFNKKSLTGCGITIQLDPYQQDMVKSGAGFKDFIGKIKQAKIGKKIIKFAKDSKILKRVGDALVQRSMKTIAGGGVKRPRGRPRKVRTNYVF